MPRALIDTTVLFAAAYRRDGMHAEGLPILRGIDDGSLPNAVVLDYVLAETLNGLTAHAGHDASVDFLDRLEENERRSSLLENSDTTSSVSMTFPSSDWVRATTKPAPPVDRAERTSREYDP